MKKLLSLLSILTISGTAVPTVMAASPYQRQEKTSSDNINLQSKNLLNKSEIISNDIYTNLLVVDTNIELRATVGWNGSDTENKVIDLGETKKYDINVTWNKIKENLSIILLKGFFEWNNYAAPQKETELYLEFDAALSNESQLVYRKDKTVTSTTGWAKQDGTVSIKLIILKLEDNYANLKIKILVSADSYDAVHNNNTFIKCLVIELKK